MIKNKKTVGFLLLAIAYFMLLGQMVHSYHHLKEIVNEKQCYHSIEYGKEQITHKHKSFEPCDLCNFSFTSAVFSIQFHKNLPLINGYSIVNNLSLKHFFSVFEGSFFSLRAPPYYC